MKDGAAVLLADDNATDAELTTHALEQGGIDANIVWVQDGAAALDYVFRTGQFAQRPSGNPRLLLLDLHMPKVDGPEVLSRVKADPKTRSIPVVIMSSSDQDIDMLRSYSLYANSYIVKPVDFREFTEQFARLGKYWMCINQVPG